MRGRETARSVTAWERRAGIDVSEPGGWQQGLTNVYTVSDERCKKKRKKVCIVLYIAKWSQSM